MTFQRIVDAKNTQSEGRNREKRMEPKVDDLGAKIAVPQSKFDVNVGLLHWMIGQHRRHWGMASQGT